MAIILKHVKQQRLIAWLSLSCNTSKKNHHFNNNYNLISILKIIGRSTKTNLYIDGLMALIILSHVNPLIEEESA
jgi:hypothetical protein